MAPSFRRRLVCFYCGCKSSQTRNPQIRRWQCEQCDAVNHLDENGEITDPPAEEISANPRYAQPTQRPTSPAFDAPEDSLFCQTCLKNQHIFSESLASYLPSQDASNYADYEKQYPKFRKELEERYPQVCEACEPRVRERIRATGYAAKTDHLRRLMERTRGGGIPQDIPRLKSLLVFVGGVAWTLSIAGQLMWDGIAILSHEHDHGELLDEDALASFASCLHQAMHGSVFSSGCTSTTNPLARSALVLGFLSLWWNPKIQERLTRTGGRILGKSEYYKLQAILLAARCLAWAYLVELPNREPASQAVMGIHCALAFSSIMLTVMSFRAISVDYAPRVIFQDSPEPVISRNSQRGTGMNRSKISVPSMHQPNSYLARDKLNSQSFSINDLAPQTKEQHPIPYQSPYQPPTTPPDEDDDEAMDWTPSQQTTLRPATLYRPLSSMSQQPEQTPFRGHLPADVVSMEHRLRNPPNKPTFRKASEAQKQNFFRTPRKGVHRDWDNVSESGTEYEPSIAETVTPGIVKFAEPKLHLQPGQTADTGLERLLANAFTLEDEPREVRSLQQQEQQIQQQARASDNNLFPRWHRLPVLMFLIASYFVWTQPLQIASNYRVQSQMATLLICTLASIRSLAIVLHNDAANRSGSDLVVFSAELVVSIGLIFIVQSPSTKANYGSIKPLATTLVAIMAVQELWMLVLDFRAEQRKQKSQATTIQSAPEAHAPPPEKPPPTKFKPENPTKPSTRPSQPSFALTQRSTRSQSKEKRPSVGSGFGSLSLGGDDRYGEQGLVRSRRGNRSGMW